MNKRLIAIVLFFGSIGGLKAQKKEVSISGGPLISFPQNGTARFIKLSTGVGLEAVGQYNFSNRSSLLGQTSLAFYGTRPKVSVDSGAKSRRTIFSIRVGYKYQFGTSGIYANILGGFEKYSANEFTNSSIALGVGKRFLISNTYFIEAGVDCISYSSDTRFDAKVLYSFFQRPKE